MIQGMRPSREALYSAWRELVPLLRRHAVTRSRPRGHGLWVTTQINGALLYLQTKLEAYGPVLVGLEPDVTII